MSGWVGMPLGILIGIGILLASDGEGKKVIGLTIMAVGILLVVGLRLAR